MREPELVVSEDFIRSSGIQDRKLCQAFLNLGHRGVDFLGIGKGSAQHPAANLFDNGVQDGSVRTPFRNLVPIKPLSDRDYDCVIDAFARPLRQLAG